MVEVFITDLKSGSEVAVVVAGLAELYPGYRITVDLEDVDRVLRIEGNPGEVAPAVVIDLLGKMGYHCVEMTDDRMALWSVSKN